MDINLPLEQMSVKEKIQIMELLWDDLCKKADSLSSPSWHENTLQERELDLKTGKAEFIGWDQAKKQIRDQIL